MEITWAFYLFIFYLLINVGNGLSPHKAMILLSRYGYMTLPTLDSLNNPQFQRSLIKDGSYKNALLKFQKTFNLPVTGSLSPAIKKLLLSTRCGNPDYGSNPLSFKMNIRKSQNSNGILHRIKRYFIDNPQMKWSKKDLKWKIKENAYPSRSLNKQQVRVILLKAFNMWAKHISLNFVEETQGGDADIVIEFGSLEHGDGIAFDGPNKVLAHAFYPPSEANTISYTRAGDAHFDNDENWVEEDQDGRNLLSVAVHELGHSMGLGHSSSEKAIMYPFYVTPKNMEIQLDQDDINGMISIYGVADRNKQLPMVPEIPKPFHPYPKPTTKKPDINKYINFCDTIIDAIIIIREVELYIFSGRLQWRIDFSKTATSWISYELRDGPEDLTYYWPVLPKNIDKIDGGIERNDQKIYIFRKSRFWLLENNLKLAKDIPDEGLPLTELGLPYYLEKIDAIFRWSHNKNIYIMAGNKYWKLNETSRSFGYKFRRYPRNIEGIWRNLPLPIDAAYTGLHGVTFFIKGKYFYEFNNLEMKVEDGGPQPLTTPWIGCKLTK